MSFVYLLEHLLHHALGGNARVVHSGHPQGHLALHSVPAGQGILNGVGQSVAQVKGASHVGRRNHHHEAPVLAHFLGLGHIRLVELALLPPGVPSSLHVSGLVSSREGIFYPLELALGGGIHNNFLGHLASLLFLLLLLAGRHGSRLLLLFFLRALLELLKCVLTDLLTSLGVEIFLALSLHRLTDLRGLRL